MRLHRFIGQYDLSKKEVNIKNTEIIKQIKDVLRLKNGEKIILSDGMGKEAEFIINSISKNEIIGEMITIKTYEETNRKVDLYLAILKKENFELAVQKSVESGVFSITPIITERTVKTGLNFVRLQKIILEASEQSGRNNVPKLNDILEFKDALLIGSATQEKIIFHPNNNFYKPNQKANTISIFIGPEGGFTERETELAKNSNYIIASLGDLILRGETAAIIATYRAVNGV